VLEAANVLATDNREEAFNYAVQQNWFSKKAASGDPARLDNISLLLILPVSLSAYDFGLVINTNGGYENSVSDDIPSIIK